MENIFNVHLDITRGGITGSILQLIIIIITIGKTTVTDLTEKIFRLFISE